MAHDKEDDDEISSEIENVCKKLGLTVFDKNQFFEYINKLNKESNEIFDYKTYAPNYFRDRFNLK